MSLYAAAVERGISGPVQIAAGQGRDQASATIFLVNGNDPYNAVNVRIGVNLADAASQSVGESLRRVQDAEQQQFAGARVQVTCPHPPYQ
ncbi:MAG: hypothetical protein E6Q88_01365 [Lysobacteraceae bacterium]|nr:MAG: hypothetical protein E6Q88_01365 [Xanthomonadaceae bacterium]